MIPPSIPAHIRQESIAGHEAAIDRIVESISKYEIQRMQKEFAS